MTPRPIPGGAGPLIRVLLADDHPVVREGIRSCLAEDPRVRVIGEAATGAEAVQMAELLQPDVVLMDISMPGVSGLEATRRIAEVAPATRVAILTIHESREYVVQVIRSGARGYVLKDAPPDDLRRAVTAVASGTPFFSPSVSQVLLEECRREVRAPREKGGEPALTPREREVLAAIAAGRSNKDIARVLGISARTVETHRARIQRKLGVRSAALLTREALARGIVENA